MATSSEISRTDDFTICSLCFEHFSTPRYLPCSHTFCHRCLNFYILSTYKTLEEPVLGFSCPVCRVFVPAPGPLGKLKQEEWVFHFPEHEFIASLMTKDVKLANPLCDACKRDNEDQEASSLCKECMEFMCQVCTKYHRKMLATKNHEVTEISQIFTCRKPQLEHVFCDKHECRKFEIFCVDHDTPCCALCVVESHRICQNFETIKNAAKELCEGENIKKLFMYIDESIKHFDKIVEEEKSNIETVYEKADKVSGEILNLKLEIMSHLNQLEQDQLDEMATVSEASRAILQRSIHSYERRKSCLLFWKDALKQIERHRSKEQLLLEYHKVKQKCNEIWSLKSVMLRTEISSKISEKALEIKNLLKLMEINVSSKSINSANVKPFDIGDINMKHVSEFRISNRYNIYGGMYLTDGKILLVVNNSEYCILYNETGTFNQKIKLMGRPWDVFLTENKLYITLSHRKEIQIMNASNWKSIESVPVKSECKGIAKSGNAFVIATGKGRVKLNTNLQHIKTIPLEYTTDDVVVDHLGNLIYSFYLAGIVTKMSSQEEIIFHYEHPNLQRSCGLACDPVGNIYSLTHLV